MPHPVPSLGGGIVRYRPLIPLSVIGPGGRWDPYVKVDTAADDVIFPLGAATRLGIDLAGASQLQAGGIGGQPVPVQYAPVILVLADPWTTYRWRATVAFTTAFLKWPLFGIAGGLEFFRTTLDGYRKEVEIVAQPHLPATQDAVP